MFNYSIWNIGYFNILSLIIDQYSNIWYSIWNKPSFVDFQNSIIFRRRVFVKVGSTAKEKVARTRLLFDSGASEPLGQEEWAGSSAVGFFGLFQGDETIGKW